MIDPGLGGPKARPKGVVDGQQVNIPALQYKLLLLTLCEYVYGVLDCTIADDENHWHKLARQLNSKIH